MLSIILPFDTFSNMHKIVCKRAEMSYMYSAQKNYCFKTANSIKQMHIYNLINCQ